MPLGAGSAVPPGPDREGRPGHRARAIRARRCARAGTATGHGRDGGRLVWHLRHGRPRLPVGPALQPGHLRARVGGNSDRRRPRRGWPARGRPRRRRHRAGLRILRGVRGGAARLLRAGLPRHGRARACGSAPRRLRAPGGGRRPPTDSGPRRTVGRPSGDGRAGHRRAARGAAYAATPGRDRGRPGLRPHRAPRTPVRPGGRSRTPHRGRAQRGAAGAGGVAGRRRRLDARPGAGRARRSSGGPGVRIGVRLPRSRRPSTSSVAADGSTSWA